MQQPATFVGVDVSKDYLDVHILPHSLAFRVENSDEGALEISRQLADLPKCLVVLESTGGFEDTLARELFRAGFAFAVVNPKRVRDFAKGLGILAKNDRIDARTLAQFGEAAKPRLSEYPDQLKQQLVAAVTRREQLVDMLRDEKNRRHKAKESARDSIDLHIRWLQDEIKKHDREIRDLIRQSPAWMEKHELFKSVPGIGDVTANILVVDLPELGRVSKTEVAKLAGLAPMDCESGKYKGQRHIQGGRKRVRCALYVAAMTAIRCNARFRAYYKRLRAAGKSAKGALVACARKMLVILNSMARNNTKFAENHVREQALMMT